MEKLYTIREIAELLNTDKQTIHNIIRKEEIETLPNTNGKLNSFVCSESSVNKINDILEVRKSKKKNVEVVIDETVELKHRVELLELELDLKNKLISSKDEIIFNLKNTIEVLSAIKPDSIQKKLYTNDIVDGAVKIKEKVVGVVSKKSNNQNPHPLVERFLADKGLTIEQVVSDQESEQFNITVAENRLSAKERSEFKKELGKLLDHKDSSSTGRTFRTYVKKVIANKE